ncbi:MAG: LysE family transporter [Haemophilus pittmaniae]|jgi:threonine efflux protein|uniref:LysE family transporter n=1 Tax=Haemophilus pittmaniae TaxID=249188 RepID=UPI0023EFB37C|nr:LysE family transporter [Haemophilus pittmaniae]MBS6027631.1 LysE family transporter [Haemophilus pittmaniae]
MLNLLIVNLFGLLSPGPDFFYVSRVAAMSSRRDALCAVIGVSLGVFIWASATILGLAVLFTAMPAVQGIIMMLGGSYLIYLGSQMVQVRENVAFADTGFKQTQYKNDAWKEIRKALWVNLSNAKVVIFFSSVMSMVLNGLHEPIQMLTALMAIVTECFLYFYIISVLFSRPMAKRFYSRYSRYIDNVAGVIFILFGLFLIYSGAVETIQSL